MRIYFAHVDGGTTEPVNRAQTGSRDPNCPFHFIKKRPTHQPCNFHLQNQEVYALISLNYIMTLIQQYDKCETVQHSAIQRRIFKKKIHF